MVGVDDGVEVAVAVGGSGVRDGEAVMVGVFEVVAVSGIGVDVGSSGTRGAVAV